MKLYLALLLLLGSICRGEDLAEGYVESFENHLKHYSHAVLICTYKDYMVDEPGNDLYQRYYEEATVVRVFKGDSKVSHRLKFYSMVEGRGRPKLKRAEPGKLSFVFFDEMPEGELHLGTGDGFRFHEKFLKLADEITGNSESGKR